MSKVYKVLDSSTHSVETAPVVNAKPGLCTSFVNHMKKSFAYFKDSLKELYVNFILHFCESYSYFALSQILIIYLHGSFGISYIEAGAAYGTWGAAITFWGFLTGCVNNRLGIRRSLLLVSRCLPCPR